MKRLALATVALILGGCGGGAGGSIAPQMPVPQPPQAPPANAQFSIVIPAASKVASSARRPQYVSAATRSVTIALQGGATLGTFDVSNSSSKCTAATDGSRKCVIAIQAPAGNDTFAITAYDQPGGTGNALASGSLVQAISASTPSTINVSLTGITASITATLKNALPPSGTVASIPIVVQAMDASGNTIIGTYDRTITLTDTDPSGHTHLSATTVNASSASITLQYDGGHMTSGATIAASASGIASPPPMTFHTAPSIAVQYDFPDILLQNGTDRGPAGMSGIVQGPDGNFWIAAATAGSIVKMTPSGQITEYWPPTAYAFPQEEVLGKDGAVWFTERDGNNIGRITMSGAITEYAIPTAYANPLGITVGPDGNIWFAEQAGNKIGKVDASGTITEYALPNGSEPIDLASGPDGNLWIDEQGFNVPAAIAVMKTDGTILATHQLAKTNPEPYGIVTGPDGNLWFGEYTGGALARMTPNGDLTEYTPPSTVPGIVSLAVSKDGNIWFAESGAAFAVTGQVGYITPGTSTIHEVYLNLPLHVRNITFDNNGALWYSGFYYIDSNVGEIIP